MMRKLHDEPKPIHKQLLNTNRRCTVSLMQALNTVMITHIKLKQYNKHSININLTALMYISDSFSNIKYNVWVTLCLQCSYYTVTWLRLGLGFSVRSLHVIRYNLLLLL